MTAIPSSLIEHAGWVLLHSVWQFATIAALIAVGNWLLKNATASARYTLLLSGLLLVSVAPVVTWFVLPQPLEDTMVAAVEPPALPLLDELSPPGPGAVQRDPAFEYSAGAPPEISNLPLIPPAIAIENVSAVKWYELLADVLQPWLSTIVVLWCVGVLLFSVRPVFGWLNVRRLRSVGTSPVAESVQQALQRIAERLRVRRRVEILASTVVTSPIVVGCFRSVILLPASFIANVPASQLEAILAHELAHVRRYDYPINLLQTLIETLFFYHPAVWWLSHRIRIERENCCDDLVVATFANKADYGRALLAVEEFRNTPVSTSTLALGAQGGSLLDRVRRLVNPPIQDERAGSAGTVALTMLTMGLLAVGFWASAETQADDETITESAEPDSLVVDIADGISLQLLAVHPHNERTKAWHPNGLPYEGSADLKEWTDTANQFPETARHLMFRWTGLENGSTRTRYKSWGPPRGKSSYFPPRGGIARLITNSAVGQDVLSVQVGLADSNWGPWVRVNKDGEVVAPMKIPPECQDAYAWINSCSIEDQGPESWFCWSGEDRVSDSAQYKIVAVMKDGNRRDYDARTFRGDSPNLESVEIFDVPLSQIGHFEYRLRPYRHWVTFDNVARQPGVKTDVQVSVKSIPIPPPNSVTAKLPNGQIIEFAGVRRSGAPASQAWGPSGREHRIPRPEWSPSSSDYGERGRQFLFRTFGFARPASIALQVPTIGHESRSSNHGELQTRFSSNIVVSGRLFDYSRLPPQHNEAEADTAKLWITDEPWGQWLQIAPDGSVLNPMGESDLHKSVYDLVRFQPTTDGSRAKNLPALQLFHPGRYSRLYDFEFRAIRSDGKECKLVNNMMLNRQKGAPENPGHVYSPREELSDISNLSRFEFRLRPYRHLVTFENVVTEGPHDEPSEVKVSVKQLTDPIPPPDSYVAKLPGGQSIELVGITNNNEPASEGWKPDGRRQQEGIGEWNPDVVLGGDARDFLFRLDGLKTVPSLRFTLPGRGAHFSSMQPDQLPGPWQLRVGGSLGDETRFEGGYFRREAGVVQVAMTDESWGKWLQVSATDGTILNPITETDKFAEGYAAVQIRRVESLRATSDPRDLPAGLGLTLYRPQQHALGHGFRVRGIDSAGEEVWLVPTSDRREVDGKSVYPVERTWRMYKPLPEGRTLSRFEFRLRPYRHLVTFENVATDGPRDEPSQVKVSVKQLANSKPLPDSYVAKLPDGLSVKLVGVAKNGSPANEGWGPDGNPISHDIGRWPGSARNFSRTFGLARRKDDQITAVDYLFEFQGRKGIPSVWYPAENVWLYAPIAPDAKNWRTRCPVNIRLDNDDAIYKTAQVLITDEPWGKWLQVSADNGQVLNPLSNEDAYRSDYNSVEIKQVTSTEYKGFAKGPALVLQTPVDHLKRYDFRIRVVDSAGDVYSMGRWGPSVDSDKKITTRTFPLHEPLPDGRTLDRFEFCLRPYRHLVTFENVATNGPCDEPSKVKVQVDTLQTDGKPSNAKTADFPSATDTSHVPLKNEPAVMWIHSKQHVHFVLYHDGFLQTGVSY